MFIIYFHVKLGFWLLSESATAFSHFLSTACPSAGVAQVVNTLTLTIFAVFCGFIIPEESIPVFWKWMYYASMYRYPLSYLTSTVMKDYDFNCSNTTELKIFVGGCNASYPPNLNNFSDPCNSKFPGFGPEGIIYY